MWVQKKKYKSHFNNFIMFWHINFRIFVIEKLKK